MSDRRLSRVLVLVVLAAAVGLFAWLLAPEPDDAPEPARAARANGRVVASAPASEAPEPVLDDAGVRATLDPAAPWASEQPPPDYMGEPSDAGASLPPPSEPEVDPMSGAELTRRRQQTIELLDHRIGELQRDIERAEQTGNPSLAAILRRRSEHLQSRRQELARLVSE